MAARLEYGMGFLKTRLRFVFLNYIGIRCDRVLRYNRHQHGRVVG